MTWTQIGKFFHYYQRSRIQLVFLSIWTLVVSSSSCKSLCTIFMWLTSATLCSLLPMLGCGVDSTLVKDVLRGSSVPVLSSTRLIGLWMIERSKIIGCAKNLQLFPVTLVEKIYCNQLFFQTRAGSAWVNLFPKAGVRIARTILIHYCTSSFVLITVRILPWSP